MARQEVPVGQPGAAGFVPVTTDLGELRAAAEGCRGCHLYKDATRTVFGGEPFVGPAGKLLDRALEEAGIDRSLVYVTNTVKRFKFRQAAPGKRRIHATPDRVEITACRPWLIAEFAETEGFAVATIHPSAVLRADDRDQAFDGLVADLKVVAAQL